MSTTTALTVASLLAMDVKALKKEFRRIASGIESGYAGLGKLIARYWELNKSRDGHYDAFADCADKSTISNAVFFAHAYRLVQDGHVDDAAFDKLASFRACRAIEKFLNDKAPVSLDPPEVARILTRKDGVKDLVSLSECGLTVKEKALADKAKADAEEAAAKAEEDARIKAAAEKLAAEKAAKDAAANPPQAEEPPSVETPPEDSTPEKTPEESGPAEETPPAETSEETTPAPASTPVAPAPKPGIPTPTAAKPVAVKETPVKRALAAYDTFESAVAELLADPVGNRAALESIVTRMADTLASIQGKVIPQPAAA